MLDGKGAAGIRPVRVDGAARIGQKGAGLFLIVRHAQQNVGEMIASAQNNVHIPIDKLIRADTQALFETDYIVGIKEQV